MSLKTAPKKSPKKVKEAVVAIEMKAGKPQKVASVVAKKPKKKK